MTDWNLKFMAETELKDYILAATVHEYIQSVKHLPNGHTLVANKFSEEQINTAKRVLQMQLLIGEDPPTSAIN